MRESALRRSARRFSLVVHVGLTLALLLAASRSPAQPLGTWDPPRNLGFRVVHGMLLPDDKILTWAYSNGPGGTTATHEIDPDTSAIEDGLGVTSSFCAGNERLPDGSVFVSGGIGRDFQSEIYDLSTDVWRRVANMAMGRYYPTAITLPDGRVFVYGGSVAKSAIPEVYTPATNTWHQETKAPIFPRWFPRGFVLPNGKLGFVNIGLGLKQPNTYDLTTKTWQYFSPAIEGGPSAMYLPGKIIISGTDPQPPTAANHVTRLVDFNVYPPDIRTAAPPHHNRKWNILTVLPDGTVLSTGGHDEKAKGVYAAEVWDPDTETWTLLAAKRVPIRREYHSVAVLLRDGRVWSGGGEPALKTAEIFNPPYLFKGPRPTISSVAEPFAAYGSSFDVFTPDTETVTKVSLIRLGAMTHANNWGQRFLWANFTTDTANGKLIVDAPANANLAPPGYYMLFLLNAQGVPSVGAFVRIGAA